MGEDVDAFDRDEGSVAIVHDYLNQRGGAERVALEMTRIWPQASLYTALYRPNSVFSQFSDVAITTTFANAVPLDQNFRILAPLLPLAFRSLGVFDQDLVISSSSGWAHGVITAPGTTHVVYCYAPARWLYSADQYFDSALRRGAMAPLGVALRRWDQRAARRATGYIAIAANVRDRIRRIYGIDADVVYPPVDTHRFAASPRGERLLCISRLLPYKRIDLVIAAATRLGIGLDVVGDGPLRDQLRQMAGPTVTFHGAVTDAALAQLINGCNAVCMPGTEDFGIVPLEGNAAGKPALAYAAGGALETIQDGVTGVLFSEQTVESVIDAIARLDKLATSPEMIAADVQKFSVHRFRAELIAAVERIAERKASRGRSKPRAENYPGIRPSP